MPKTKTRIRLTHAAAMGLKELPSNTAWLLGKAWHPATEELPGKMTNLSVRVSEAAHSAAESAGPTVAGAKRKVSDAGRLLADARIGKPRQLRGGQKFNPAHAVAGLASGTGPSPRCHPGPCGRCTRHAARLWPSAGYVHRCPPPSCSQSRG